MSQDDEFSFNCGELDASPIAADDAFVNGQIRAFLPLSDAPDFAFSGHDLPVKKIFVETNDGDNVPEMPSSGPGGEEVVGPCCSLSGRKAVEAVGPAERACKKSNSTGFSRIWRIKDQDVGRSHSDRNDAFVFLNDDGDGSSEGEDEKGVKSKKKKKKKKKKKWFKWKKSSKTSSVSANEAHLRCKAFEEDERQRTYLPYLPEMRGFFTNVNGRLTKNVHPY